MTGQSTCNGQSALAPALADREVAIEICREISRIENSETLQWAFLHSIEERLDLDDAAVQFAVRYGAEQGWLLLEGEPVHSVILCDAAAAIIKARDG
jgi:hypothetical protein